MIETTTSYATDEDLALRASADFLLLCPRDQKLASGNDGVFQKDDPWTLNSASVDFQANGLSPGKIVLLTQPTSSFKPPGESFVVQAVSPGAVLLRRKGQLPGMGQGPSGPNGLTGVEFFSTTLGPQIELASYDINKRYGIDDFIAGRRSCDLFDTREVREATVLTVLYRQYLEMSRGSEERADLFATKARLYKEELSDLLARTVIHWNSRPGTPTSSQSITRMATRMSR